MDIGSRNNAYIMPITSSPLADVALGLSMNNVPITGIDNVPAKIQIEGENVTIEKDISDGNPIKMNFPRKVTSTSYLKENEFTNIVNAFNLPNFLNSEPALKLFKRDISVTLSFFKSNLGPRYETLYSLFSDVYIKSSGYNLICTAAHIQRVEGIAVYSNTEAYELGNLSGFSIFFEWAGFKIRLFFGLHGEFITYDDTVDQPFLILPYGLNPNLDVYYDDISDFIRKQSLSDMDNQVLNYVERFMHDGDDYVYNFIKKLELHDSADKSIRLFSCVSVDVMPFQIAEDITRSIGLVPHGLTFTVQGIILTVSGFYIHNVLYDKLLFKLTYGSTLSLELKKGFILSKAGNKISSIFDRLKSITPNKLITTLVTSEAKQDTKIQKQMDDLSNDIKATDEFAKWIQTNLSYKKPDFTSLNGMVICVDLESTFDSTLREAVYALSLTSNGYLVDPRFLDNYLLMLNKSPQILSDQDKLSKRLQELTSEISELNDFIKQGVVTKKIYAYSGSSGKSMVDVVVSKEDINQAMLTLIDSKSEYKATKSNLELYYLENKPIRTKSSATLMINDRDCLARALLQRQLLPTTQTYDNTLLRDLIKRKIPFDMFSDLDDSIIGRKMFNQARLRAYEKPKSQDLGLWSKTGRHFDLKSTRNCYPYSDSGSFKYLIPETQDAGSFFKIDNYSVNEKIVNSLTTILTLLGFDVIKTLDVTRDEIALNCLDLRWLTYSLRFSTRVAGSSDTIWEEYVDKDLRNHIRTNDKNLLLEIYKDTAPVIGPYGRIWDLPIQVEMEKQVSELAFEYVTKGIDVLPQLVRYNYLNLMDRTLVYNANPHNGLDSLTHYQNLCGFLPLGDFKAGVPVYNTSVTSSSKESVKCDDVFSIPITLTGKEESNTLKFIEKYTKAVSGKLDYTYIIVNNMKIYLIKEEYKLNLFNTIDIIHIVQVLVNENNGVESVIKTFSLVPRPKKLNPGLQESFSTLILPTDEISSLKNSQHIGSCDDLGLIQLFKNQYYNGNAEPNREMLYVKALTLCEYDLYTSTDFPIEIPIPKESYNLVTMCGKYLPEQAIYNLCSKNNLPYIRVIDSTKSTYMTESELQENGEFNGYSAVRILSLDHTMLSYYGKKLTSSIPPNQLKDIEDSLNIIEDNRTFYYDFMNINDVDSLFGFGEGDTNIGDLGDLISMLL